MNQIELVSLSTPQVTGERQRRDDASQHVKELADSIRQNGLLHAVVLTESNQLVSGWCRLQAVKKLAAEKVSFYYNGTTVEPGWLPVVRTHKIDQVDLFQIELEENIRRKNLSFLEQAQAIAQLHHLRTGANPSWSKKATAVEIAELRGKPTINANDEKEVADALILSQFANDPAIAKARTKNIAVRLASRKLEQEALAALGVSAEISSTRHQIIVGDSLTVLSDLKPGTFDCILTDPPYGIDAHNFGSAGFQNAGHKYKDDAATALAAYKLLAQMGYWLCQEEAHLFAFLDIRQFAQIQLLFETNNWIVWPTPLIWYKGSVAHAPRPEHGPKRTYEAILFASKGDKPIVKQGQDTLIIQSVSSRTKVHPAEKPVELFEELLSWVLQPGMQVLDPFAGSGTIFPAADNLGCDATGVELDPMFAGIARQRIDELNKL